MKRRKNLRLKGYDYSQNGAYFLTICVKDKRCILSKIVGSDAPDAPLVILSKYGAVVENEIIKMNSIYDYINVEKYVIMPNHIHLIVNITKNDFTEASRASLPTKSIIAKYVSTLKRFCNKAYGENIWQTSYYDHVIRNNEDYVLHLQYVDENPKKWLMGKDEYYS